MVQKDKKTRSKEKQEAAAREAHSGQGPAAGKAAQRKEADQKDPWEDKVQQGKGRLTKD